MGEPLKHRADLDGPFDSQDPDDIEKALRRGEFCYHRDAETKAVKWITFWPVDCPTWLTVSILPHRQKNGHSWTLSGTEAAPTLHPSVNAGRVWHGFLIDGVARSC